MSLLCYYSSVDHKIHFATANEVDWVMPTSTGYSIKLFYAPEPICTTDARWISGETESCDIYITKPD